MSKAFEYSDGSRRFHTLDWELKKLFGKKVVKIPLDLGLGCPNRDGTKGVGGCTFCSEFRSGEFSGDMRLSLAEQFDETKKLYSKWPDALYIAYFQAGTNTYAPVHKLKRLFNEALSLPDVVGLSISTRPDCISDEIADMLAELSKKTYLTVELGLQSAKNATLARINRGHTYEEFLAGYNKLVSRDVKVCIHIINGLPGETKQDMLETAKQVAKLSPYEIKIHLLHIISGTKMADEFAAGEFDVMSFEDYVNTVCDQLEMLPPETVVARLTGDGDRKTLIAPDWSRDKRKVLNEIDKELRRRDSQQGKSHP